MATPLSGFYYEFRTTNIPHSASVTDHDGVWYGLVKHGSGSSTTLQKKFKIDGDALAHAQIFADALNNKDAHDIALRHRAFVDELEQHIANHHDRNTPAER